MKFALLLVLAFTPGFAQPQPAAETAVRPQSSPATVTKIIHVVYGNPHKLADLAAPGLPVSASADEVLQVIVLKGEPTAVASAEQTIHELDTPPRVPISKNVELTVLVVGGSNAGAALAPDQTSEEVGPVIRQLRAIFPYKNYQVLSSMLLRSREGEPAGNDGIMGNLASPASDLYPSVYSLHYDHAHVSVEGGKPIIHFKNFRFQTHVDRHIGGSNPDPMPMATTQFKRFDIGIGTGVDIREGQRIVAGKANIDSSDSALFVVLTAKLVD